MITNMLETSFQELGFKVTLLLSLVILQGPFSWNRPIMLELPGCVHSGKQLPLVGIGEWKTYTTVQPDGQRRGIWTVTRFEEPEPRDQQLELLYPHLNRKMRHSPDALF